MPKRRRKSWLRSKWSGREQVDDEYGCCTDAVVADWRIFWATNHESSSAPRDKHNRESGLVHVGLCSARCLHHRPYSTANSGFQDFSCCNFFPMEHPALLPVLDDEYRQERDHARFSRLRRVREELLADVSGPMTPQSFLDSISSFVTYLPLDIDRTDSGPLYFLPRSELDQDIKDALAETWCKLDEGNADWVYPVHRSEWFTTGWDYVVEADHDWADDAISEDWNLCS